MNDPQAEQLRTDIKTGKPLAHDGFLTKLNKSQRRQLLFGEITVEQILFGKAGLRHFIGVPCRLAMFVARTEAVTSTAVVACGRPPKV